MLGGSDAKIDARIFLFPGFELGEFFGKDFFALMSHADESSIATFGGASPGYEFGEAFNLAFLFGDTSVFGGFFGGVLASKIAVIAIIEFHFVGDFIDEESFVGDSV